MSTCLNPVFDGDMICLVAGCRLPLMIRKEVDDHVLVGECFVWGLMDGEYREVLKGMEAEDLWETFRLR